MATIEPRLIHLLNDTTTPLLPSTDLPPLSALPFPPSRNGTLPPLEQDQPARPDRAAASSELMNQVTGYNTQSSQREDGTPYSSQETSKEVHRDSGNHGGPSLSMLLSDTDYVEPTVFSLNKSVEDVFDIQEESANKKRAHGMAAKDDFVQLPQPVKKQKAAQQSLTMPPIINGLHEPPPHAALFPPIASSSVSVAKSSQIKLLHGLPHPDGETERGAAVTADKTTPKARKRAAKPRRKWSEDETKHLLLGVSRYGLGKWTCILEDPNFEFNDRTAGDLKDRFRTCCPDELREGSKLTAADKTSSASAKSTARKGTGLAKILIDETNGDLEENAGASAEEKSTTKPKRSRAHRKKMEDLAEMGIHAPFKKSHRRERRPFTEQDDREILDGLDQWGPAWTRIQRHPEYNLSSRQPTDLRDRVRNKYPRVYARIERGALLSKEPRKKELLEPSVNMSIDHSLERSRNTSLALPMTRQSSKDEFHKWSMTTTDDPMSHLEYSAVPMPHNMGGEMDISRLLLEDPNVTSAPIRNGHEHVFGMAPLHGLPGGFKPRDDRSSGIVGQLKFQQ